MPNSLPHPDVQSVDPASHFYQDDVCKQTRRTSAGTLVEKCTPPSQPASLLLAPVQCHVAPVSFGVCGPRFDKNVSTVPLPATSALSRTVGWNVGVAKIACCTRNTSPNVYTHALHNLYDDLCARARALRFRVLWSSYGWPVGAGRFLSSLWTLVCGAHRKPGIVNPCTRLRSPIAGWSSQCPGTHDSNDNKY